MATVGYFDHPNIYDPLSGRMYGNMITMPVSGQITAINVYLQGPDTGSTGYVAAGIYSDNAGQPKTKLATVAAIALPVAQAAAWQTFTLGTPLSVNAGPIWAALYSDSNNSVAYTSAVTVANIEREDSNASYPTWDDPWQLTGSNSNPFAIYVTYTPDQPQPFYATKNTRDQSAGQF